MERLTQKNWRNLDPWECCGQDNYCQRGCHEAGGCNNGCIVPKNYRRLAKYEDTGLTPEQIEALTADKDEQAGRMDYLLRRTLPILEATNNQQELIQAINALLGGKEDA